MVLFAFSLPHQVGNDFVVVLNFRFLCIALSLVLQQRMSSSFKIFRLL